MRLRPGPLRFLAMAAGVFLAVMATTYAVALLIPDANDYALASKLKHSRLALLPSPKIVLVGGSNLAYGVDSAAIERETKCRVVNMGMNGFLGARFMLHQVGPYLKKSDIVVISLEYQNFYNSVDGVPTDQFMLVKANPRLLSYLGWRQRWSAFMSALYVGQQKVFRLLREGDDFMRSWLGQSKTLSLDDQLIKKIEISSGFNIYGDLVSHLGVGWSYSVGDQFDLSNSTVDSNVIPLLQSFAKNMRSRGVDTIYSYSPLQRSFYNVHRQAVAILDEKLRHASPLIVSRPPLDYVFDDSLIFDTIYHLGENGRALRTQKLIDDIKRVVLKGGTCEALMSSARKVK
jgi:hypothetical protein